MKMSRSPRLLGRVLRSPVALLVLAAACTDDSAAPPTSAIVDPEGVLGVLQCEVTVASGDMTCVDASATGASASRAEAGGPSLVTRTFGQNGTFVRLANSGNSRAGGVYSMNVTVQNLANLAMATPDGATRHAEGVRVWFNGDPVATRGPGDVSVANATGTAMFTAANQPYFQYGGSIGGTDQGELGADGVLASAETSTAKSWQFNLDATVEAFSFYVYVRTETAPGTLQTVAPQVAGVSPSPMVPGQAATLTGSNFSLVPGSNTVRIGGTLATVTGSTATTLTVVVPCVASGNVAVQVTQGGMTGVATTAPLAANEHALAVGGSAIVANAADVGCNVLLPTGAASKYVMAVYNTSSAPGSTVAFQVASSDAAAALPAAAAGPSLSRVSTGGPAVPARMALGAQEGDVHLRIMETSRREHERLRTVFANDARMRPRHNVTVNADPPPATKTIRLFNVLGTSCNDYVTVTATRVYYNGKIAIYEDDATQAGLKAGANAAMQDYYNRIGDQFNADMEPIVRNNFGDPLLRDAVTDANGVLIALFTPKLNGTGAAGFVVSCDQFPNSATNGASNFGEYFYAYQPTVVGTGYGSFTPDSWYWSIRATFIHETKHVASHAARVVNGANFENSWLEEGTARHAEELWARQAVYNVAWKANTGYGSAAAPGSLYCDYRQTSAACLATDPSRPSLNMNRHFDGLFSFMGNPTAYSPFGATSLGGSSWYATSWSLVRYAIDRYGASDAAFLSALNSSTTRGTTNLADRAGVSLEQLMGGWALAMYADDYPGVASPGLDIQMPTWNFRSIYSGLATDWGDPNYPLVPQALTLGSFGTVSVPSVAGGGVAYFELSGTHAAKQILKLAGSGGGALPSTLRVAIARIQ
jgi:hypothetical protein